MRASEAAAAALAVLALLPACQRGPAPPAGAPAPASAARLRADGAARLAERDWAGALDAYRQAVLVEPESLAVRYGIGLALAQLGRADEAVTAFLWVVDHGPAERDEVRVARQWLIDAGIIAVDGPSPAPPASGDDRGRLGSVVGRTDWPRLDPAGSRPHAQILLDGDEPATRGRRYWARAALGEPFEIARVVSGRYRVMAQVGPVRLWDTTVVVQDGRPTRLDLTPATAVAAPDALTPPRS